ncbi:MAG TPA: hypothetical protein VHO49_09695 [Anaerolineales bacterium]|nr:hypothetical protein [Anaerolineales bacterium]
MDIELSTILKSKRMLVHILSIFLILVMAFPATGNVNALMESAPPEGGHDGSEGVGHANSCNAFGWAQDPDDATREVQVRILDNGNEIASGMTDGHGFSFNLWGLFPTYEDHQITVQAHDEETGAWADLVGTPRWLNCVNYDIYLLNTKSGKVERLTTLEDTGEYNPSWSPDGKRIVHDVTDANFHALYITDIKTRMSQPLPGADGGNDADWSPDGSWILFDRGPYGDPSLYLLPPAGGTPALLVENAIRGDWSPDSQRVVFEREGTIWTASIAGGDETLVAETGSNPVWSKDGLWIAYDLDGDLWKVGVDLNGSRTGEPVQLTSGPVNEGGPTWSNNGRSIVFSSDASGDFDIWEISSSGGAPIQLRGALGFGDYDPAFSNNGQYIAYDGAMQPSVPHIESDARLNSYALVDWPTGQSISVQVDDPATGRRPDYRTTFTPDGSGNFYSFQPNLDLRPGFVIQARSMYFEKTLVLSELAATSVDAENGIVSGVASADHGFYMVTDGDHFRLPIGLGVNTDENGTWSMDFSGYDTPLPWEWFTGGEMFEWDEDGDMTHARWHVHQEVVEIWLAQNEIRAFDWPVDTELHFSVYDPDTDQTYDYFTGTVPQDWFDGTAAVISTGDLRLMPGMTVSVTDGITEKSTVIQDIKITTMDVNNDLVSGYAPPNASLDLGSFEDSPGLRFFNADINGDWSVDYREPSLNGLTVDLNPGDSLRLFMREEDKDSTVWEAFAPNTRFTVFPEWNYLEGYEWPDGAVVFISVAGKEACSTEAVSGFPDWDQSNTFFSLNFPEGCILGAGDLITLHAGPLSLTHQVQDLVISEVSVDADTVAGTAVFDAAQYFLHTWIHGVDGSYMQLSAEGGSWLADFGSLGFDLQLGIGGRVELVDQASNATAVDWYILNPRFVVFPEWEWFDGNEWPEGALVDITVLGKSECTTQVVSPGSFFNGPFGEGCDVVIGDTVTFTDGATVRTHTVRNLTVISVDREANTVTGTADEGQAVYVWPHATGQQMQAIADPSNTWQVDFTDIFDLVEGTDGRSEIRDEQGNATAVDWRIPDPHFSVFPEWEYVEGWEWPDGATVSATIEGKPACSVDGISGHPEWDPNALFVPLWFPEDCDVVVGDVVTLTDGVAPRTHTVRKLTVTTVDKVANTITGTADAEAMVHVWPHGYNELLPTADENGVWLADFNSIAIDLVEGMAGRTEIRDDESNATSVEWHILSTHVVVQITDDWFRAEAFLPNTALNFRIYGAPGGNLVLESTTPETDPSGTISHWVGDQIDLQPGYQVIVSDGVTTRDIVLEALTFDLFDTTLGLLQGTAPEPFGRTVWAAIGFENDAWAMEVSTDLNGKWNADFGAPVPSDYQWVAAQIFDTDGDASEVRPTLLIE